MTWEAGEYLKNLPIEPCEHGASNPDLCTFCITAHYYANREVRAAKKVLITGGAGFIGSHLAERHLALGDKVCVIDDLSTGSMANIEHLMSPPQFRKWHSRAPEPEPQFSYWIASVTSTPVMEKLVDLADVIYHLAAAVGVRLILDSPVRTIETNVRCTEIVLALAAKKLKRVLITSTSEVYGKQEQVPFCEDDDLVLGATSKARWSYACSKALDECLAIAYWKERRVPTVIARLFNTVGPRQTGRYGMVVPTFVAQALAGADIRVFGDGTQSRCFTDVSDAVDALVGIAAHPEANGEVYNVGGTQEITIRELAHKIKEMTGSKSRIVFVPYGAAYPEGFEDMVRRVPSITKLHQLTGYTPKVSLEQSLQRIIDSVAPASRDCLCRHAIEMFDGIHHDQRCQYYKPTQPVAGAA